MKLTELLEEIHKETTISTEWEDPTFLSILLLKLVSHYATLGPIVAEAEKEADTADVHYKVVREQTKLDSIKAGETVKASEAKGLVQSLADQEYHIELKYKARLLFLTRQNLDKTIDAIRSRLSFMKRDRENSNV